ncbi:glycine-rich RNA-binding protein 2-like [Forsythia ovata]|uniref:Glycine-rich RNA-binding protein 2-like n=1 Tax=Forsythia ovata TaxID=205694 RepID=A0ABD1VK06_9LAMI
MASGDVEFRCFVGGLAWATTDQSLEQAFSQFGEVIESKEWLAHYLDHTWPQRSSQIDKDSSRDAQIDKYGPSLTMPTPAITLLLTMMEDLQEIENQENAKKRAMRAKNVRVVRGLMPFAAPRR